MSLVRCHQPSFSTLSVSLSAFIVPQDAANSMVARPQPPAAAFMAFEHMLQTMSLRAVFDCASGVGFYQCDLVFHCGGGSIHLAGADNQAVCRLEHKIQLIGSG